jgi:transcriptional regulator with XRE-family HTH domain
MAEEIRNRLKEFGMSQVTFSKYADCSEKHLSQVLTGKKVAQMETLERWAFLLGLEFQLMTKDVMEDSHG